MAAGGRQSGLSISHTQVSRVYPGWCEKQIISSERQFCRWKGLAVERVQRRDWFKTLYNRVVLKSI